jgi:acyl dehydratase
MRFASLTPGRVIEVGPRAVSEAEIIEFAARYDAQWFHVDPVRAAVGRWQGLIASGWHSCAIMMEMAVTHILADSESFGSPGLENLGWLEPVRPGDALNLRVEVLEARRSASGGTGIVRWRWELWNQRSARVLTTTCTSLFELDRGAAPVVTAGGAARRR